MKETRHPHPHVDPRQPRRGAAPGTNPPVFAWKPATGQSEFRLIVARDETLSDTCLDVDGLADPVYLPDNAFAPGRYFWQWSAGGDESEVFGFELPSESVVLEVPPVGRWLERFSPGHPRIFLRPEDVPALRASRNGERAGRWEELRALADSLLDASHEMAEPPFLPDIKLDYQAYYDVWRRIMWESRRLVKGAEILALAYLAGGDSRYARAACRRMVSVSRWDPEGSTHIGHNDEAHMSVIWHGAKVCDWVWDQFTDEERASVIAQFRRRGEITYEHMHDRGCYGVTRFDSHAGREVVFLALIGFVFHEHIPDAITWLEWLRPVLCGIWPIWAGDDGAWAEGPAYGTAYVNIMTMFATALKRGTGVDLYRRPFWKNHAAWRQRCWPPYAEWLGFGDHTERDVSLWLRNANLVELIGPETGTTEFAGYAGELRDEAARCSAMPDRELLHLNSQVYLAPPAASTGEPAAGREVLRVFPAAGWAAIRTNLDDPPSDLAFIFRSSPYGAISHSHANNNDFIIHVAGKVMAMPSGYYGGYGSDHHAHWVWHTRSHNCVTLSGAGQLMRSHESRGAIQNAHEDERLVYMRGNADASYSDRAERCRRHVLFLKPHGCFVIVDEFVAAPGIASALEWNIHSWNTFGVNEQERTFLIEREGSSLEGHFMYRRNAFFSLSEGWDPPPLTSASNKEWRQQHHLRFTASGYDDRRSLGVVLCPGHARLPRAEVRTAAADGAEAAHVGDDLVLVNQGEVMAYEGVRSEALVALIVQGRRYELGGNGLEY